MRSILHETRCLKITDLPPEILERIFTNLSHDLRCMRRISLVCTHFSRVSVKVPVVVQIPVSEPELSWLQHNSVPVRYLVNFEIAVYVADQIFRLNLHQTRVAKLVGYDYQSRKCEVTPHYLQIIECLRQRSRLSLRRLALNVDLTKGNRYFKFAEIITSFKNLRSLSLHFSAHIELNQRILKSEDAQNLLNILLANLTSLKTFNIFICPPRKLRLQSESLQELGIYKSDSVEVKCLHLPNLLKLTLHETVADLFRKIMSDRETGGSHLHRDLLNVVYEGCPSLESLNNVKLSPQLGRGTSRPDKEEWTKLVNKCLVGQYRRMMKDDTRVVI